MNIYHKNLLDMVEKESKTNPTYYKLPVGYSGDKNSKKDYNLSNPQIRHILNTFKQNHSNIESSEFLKLLNSLYKGISSTEKYISGYLLEYYPNLRKQVKPKNLDQWINNLVGWAQIDSLCQSRFSAEEILSNWKEWKKLLTEFSKSPNISKKRASLVLLTKPVRDIRNDKLKELAFENIDQLKSEKDILITKAISWLLRDMTKSYRKEVIQYLKDNKDSLPKIALRETTRKLETGKK